MGRADPHRCRGAGRTLPPRVREGHSAQVQTQTLGRRSAGIEQSGPGADMYGVCPSGPQTGPEQLRSRQVSGRWQTLWSANRPAPDAERGRAEEGPWSPARDTWAEKGLEAMKAGT